ncbi:MAG: Zn-dependent hydrolase [Verrucomicrobiota bacterium]
MMTLDEAIEHAGDRMLPRIQTLKSISQNTEWLERILFSPAAEEAAYRIKGWMLQNGMEVREDPLTNVVGLLQTSPDGPNAPTIHLGSHYDTVINAGAYDGNLGVLIALAVAEVVQLAKVPLQHNLSAMAFCDEEGVRFQSTFLGSAFLSGQFEREWLDMPDEFGKTLGEWLVDRAESIDEVLNAEPLIRPQDYFLESHIEQGPILESAGKPLGVFTRIAAQMRAEVELIGCAGHAGTTPARLRKDPLPIACEMVTVVNEVCRSDERIRATVGQLEVYPNASNVIPERVRFTIDLRQPKHRNLLKTHAKLLARIEAIAKRSGLEYRYKVSHEAADVACDPMLVDLLSEASESLQGNAVQIFSGAGHDSMKIAGVCPVGLLAVRCRGGLSHHPDEFASEEDCRAALKVMVETVIALDRKAALDA